MKDATECVQEPAICKIYNVSNTMQHEQYPPPHAQLLTSSWSTTWDLMVCIG
jgi:hypothetical protein